MNSIITSLIFLFVIYAIAYVIHYSQNPDIQIKVDNLNILETNRVV